MIRASGERDIEVGVRCHNPAVNLAIEQALGSHLGVSHKIHLERHEVHLFGIVVLFFGDQSEGDWLVACQDAGVRHSC